MSIITYEIWSKFENEPLVDGLTSEEAINQLPVYRIFYGDSVYITSKETSLIVNHTTSGQEYKAALVDFFEELQMMGNLN